MYFRIHSMVTAYYKYWYCGRLNAVHAWCVYRGPQLTREEQHNYSPADTDVYLHDKGGKYIYTVELHQGTAHYEFV